MLGFFIKLFYLFLTVLLFSGCYINTNIAGLTTTSESAVVVPDNNDAPTPDLPLPTPSNPGNPASKILLDMFSDVVSTYVDLSSYEDSADVFRATDGRLWLAIGERSAFDSFFFNYIWIVKVSDDNGLTWSEVDRFQYNLDGSSVASSIIQSPNGDILVLGTVLDKTLNESKAYIRRTQNNGLTWTEFESFNPPANPYIDITGFDVDSAGYIYYSFKSLDFPTSEAFVRRYDPNTLTWTTIEDLRSINGAANSYGVYGIFVDSSNALYVLGSTTNSSPSFYRWVLRKTTDKGQTWTTLSNLASPYIYGLGSSLPIFVNTNGDILIGTTNSGNSNWMIYRSTNQGSSWTAVDNLSAGSRGQPIAFAKDTSGNLYAGGIVGGTPRGLIRKSTDNGLTWTTSSTFSHADLPRLYPVDMVTFPTGEILAINVGATTAVATTSQIVITNTTDQGSTWNQLSHLKSSRAYSQANDILMYDENILISVGLSYSSQNIPKWIVRRSTDKGLNWTVTDSFQDETSGNEAQSVNKDENGNIFVAGRGLGPERKWIVRKSSDQGLTWNTVDSFADYANGAVPKTVKTKGSRIYVAGYIFDASNISHSFIRVSSNQGNSWSTLNDYSFESGYSSSIRDFAVCPNGHLYTSETGEDNLGDSRWIIRKSVDQGANWTISQNYLNGYMEGQSISCSIDNKIVATANDWDINLWYSNWLVRYSADGGSSWSTIDNYTFGPGLTTENKSVFMDTNSTIYVVGTYDNNGANSRLLRKSTDLGLTWINEIDSVVASPTITSPKKTIFNAVRDCGSGNVCTAGSEASFDGNTKWIADRF